MHFQFYAMSKMLKVAAIFVFFGGGFAKSYTKMIVFGDFLGNKYFLMEILDSHFKGRFILRIVAHFIGILLKFTVFL